LLDFEDRNIRAGGGHVSRRNPGVHAPLVGRHWTMIMRQTKTPTSQRHISAGSFLVAALAILIIVNLVSTR
jgi:hypothetical protein